MTYLEELFFRFAPYFGETFVSSYGVILFPVKVKYFRKAYSTWGNYNGFKREIQISPTLKEFPNALEGVLLHEMVHAFLHAKYNSDKPSGHGHEFEGIQWNLNVKHFGQGDAHKIHFKNMLAVISKDYKF